MVFQTGRVRTRAQPEIKSNSIFKDAWVIFNFSRDFVLPLAVSAGLLDVYIELMIMPRVFEIRIFAGQSLAPLCKPLVFDSVIELGILFLVHDTLPFRPKILQNSGRAFERLAAPRQRR
jgi:hypothetical protein